MVELAALQARMAEAILTGEFAGIEAQVAPGPVPAAEALSVHRGTAIGGLVNALRLSHPTVFALVGEDFFGQAARDFIARAPPSGAWLTGYGEGFADFLAAYDHARELPYLADVARFDFALERVGGAAPEEYGPACDLGATTLALDASLRIVALDYPADAIRDALEEDEERLAGLDMRPGRRTFALWRRPEGVGMRRLAPVSAAFVAAVLRGDDLSGFDGPEADLQVLSAEVFSAPFAQVSLKPS